MKQILLLLCLVILSSNFALSQETWKQINVFPEVTKLNAVDALGDLVISVGNYGVAKYSLDYGESWFTVQTGTHKVLNDVAILDAERAIAVGEDGCVIYTLNSGADWQLLDINTDEDLLDVQYNSDSNYGLISGKDGYLAESVGDLKKWNKVGLSGNENMNGSCIFDSNSAIICCSRGKIFTKVGNTWRVKLLNIDDDVLKIEKKGENTAFIVTENLNGYITTDRGKSWEKIYIDNIKPADIDVIVDLVIGQYVSVIVIRGKGCNARAVEYVSSNLYIWQRFNKGIMNNGYGNNDICFSADKEKGIAVDNYGGASIVDPGIAFGFIYSRILSTDMTYIRDLDIFDNTWAVMGTNYYKYHLSRDAGNTWNSVDLDIRDSVENINFTCLQMTDYNSIYLAIDKSRTEVDGNTTTIYSEAVFVESDYDGKVLKYYEFPEKHDGLGMDFVNKDVGIYYTSNLFWVTTDGGSSWEPIERNIQNRRTLEMELLASGEIYSLEYMQNTKRTYLCKSDDLGKTWTEFELPYVFNSFKCKGKDTILADYSEIIADNTYIPHLLLSIDGGMTWKDLDIGVEVFNSKYTIEYSAYDVSKIIVTCGVDYQILFTSVDMGESWTREAENLSKVINNQKIIDIEFADGRPVIASNNQFIATVDVESGVDLKSISEDKGWRIYPNPASKALNIDTDNIDIACIRICTLDLRLLKEVCSGSKNTINIADLPSGSYLLIMESDNGSLESRLFNIVR